MLWKLLANQGSTEYALNGVYVVAAGDGELSAANAGQHLRRRFQAAHNACVQAAAPASRCTRQSTSPCHLALLKRHPTGGTTKLTAHINFTNAILATAQQLICFDGETEM